MGQAHDEARATSGLALHFQRAPMHPRNLGGDLQPVRGHIHGVPCLASSLADEGGNSRFGFDHQDAHSLSSFYSFLISMRAGKRKKLVPH